MLTHRLPLRLTLVAALIASAALRVSAQTSATIGDNARNPLAGDPDAIKQGQVLFRQECVYCHGVGARGGARGPDLTTGAWVHGGSDADLWRTVKDGVQGTAMPAHRLTDREIWEILSYLRAAQQPPSSPLGDPARGETLFFAGNKCSSCHMVKGRGGRLGPELTAIGSARPLAYLVESIRDPGRQLAGNHGAGADLLYDTITAVTRDGKTIVGVAMNEDTFTIQMMDRSERVYSFDKKSLKSLQHEKRSLMPAYGTDAINDKDLQDLVAYLQSLRATPPAREKGTSDGVR